MYSLYWYRGAWIALKLSDFAVNIFENHFRKCCLSTIKWALPALKLRRRNSRFESSTQTSEASFWKIALFFPQQILTLFFPIHLVSTKTVKRRRIYIVLVHQQAGGHTQSCWAFQYYCVTMAVHFYSFFTSRLHWWRLNNMTWRRQEFFKVNTTQLWI